MEIAMKDSNFEAGVWFILAAAVAAAGIFVWFTSENYLIASFSCLSLILFCYGRQRTKNWRMAPDKFKKIILILALFLALASSVGGLLSC